MSKQQAAQAKREGIRPNTFPTPNEHVDYAMEMLTSDEYKVLNFAIRHTWGWHVDQKAMALSMFTHGYGPYSGVGLSRATVIKCLAELSKYKFLIPVGKADSEGQVWSVGLDPDLDGLQDRFEEKKRQRGDIMSPLRDKKKKKLKTAVYDTDRSMTQTDSGLHDRPTAVYDIDASKDSLKDTTKDSKRKEILTASAVADAIFAPSSDDAYDASEGDAAMFPLEGKKQKSARAEKAAQRLAKTATTPPPPTPAPETPPMDAAKPLTPNQALAVALGEAWGGPIPNSEWNLYINQAKKLVQDVPVEEFKAYCDWRKEQLWNGAAPLRITQLTGSGYVGLYIQQRDAKAAEEEAARKLLASIPPEYLPRTVPPEQRATPEQIEAAIAKFRTPLFSPSDAGEKIS